MPGRSTVRPPILTATDWPRLRRKDCTMEDLTQAPGNPTTREKQEQQHGKK